jgi:hypothetical protein
MIQLAVRRVIEQPLHPEWTNERSFASPASSWVAYFHDPFEWHMGAEGWKLSLLLGGRDETSRHRYLRAIASGKGYYMPHKYHPWCDSRPVLALNGWDSVLHVYDVTEHRGTQRSIQFPMEIQWTPRGEKLAVTQAGRITVIDVNNDASVDVLISHPPDQYPELFWWPDGKSFFVASRTSARSKTELAFFNAADGRLLGHTDFDPADLLPYDADAYRKIARDGYSLRVGRGTRSVGSLLDRWLRIEFEPETQLLRAIVYRPISACEESDGQYTCAVEERGVEVAVDAQLAVAADG